MASENSPYSNWQRRWHPLLQQWVVIAATSGKRPWSGAVVERKAESKPAHDPGCYLCPGVDRAGGHRNPDYHGPFAFDNDFPSLSMQAPDIADDSDPLLQVAPAQGRCRVLCWTERHDLTLADLTSEGMRAVVDLWRSEYRTLSADPAIHHVLMFENKGVEIGVSNLHPHGQIYAGTFVPDMVKRMREGQAHHAKASGTPLLLDLLNRPHVQQHLVVEKNTHWSVIVPFFARYAFETWIVPHRFMNSLLDATDAELDELGACYQRQVRRYDALFQCSAPNITVLQNSPTDTHPDNAHWQFHVVFHPPLRAPNIMKYFAGYETGTGNVINPVQPEDAAARLRETVVPQ